MATIDFDIEFSKDDGYINIHDELNDRDELQVVGGGIEMKSRLIANVQSKIGKVIEGYDPNDGFIDDTEAIDPSAQTKKLEMEAFRVSLVQKQNTTIPRSDSGKMNTEQTEGSSESILEQLEPLIEELNTKMSAEQNDFIHRISANKKQQYVAITNDMLETIHKIINKKIELETANNPNPSKKKIDQWRKEGIDFVFSKCFEIEVPPNTYQLTTIRRLRIAYVKYTKEKENPENPPKLPAGADTSNEPIVPTVDSNNWIIKSKNVMYKKNKQTI